MRRITCLAAGLLALSTIAAASQPSPKLGPVVTLPEKKPVAAVPQALPVPPQARPLTKEDVDTWLDGYLPYALRVGDIAGAEIAIVKDGKVLTERGYGYADVAKRTPVDPFKTVFRPGSVSKLFTWTAVMQLVERGKLNLDADVNRYLDFRIPPFDGRPVTLRNLMTHTAGFEESGKDVMFYDEKNPAIRLDNYVRRAIPRRIFRAGTIPAYSNYGATLAGYIVERISGEPFDSYIERHIFAPLQMQNSTFRQPLPARFRGMMAKGYYRASAAPTPYELVGGGPAGSLASTADDMAHFMIAHLQGGEFEGQRILLPATAEQMHNSPLTLMPAINRMELGFFETNINGREVIAHEGDSQVFHTTLNLFLSDKVGIYVSVNSLGKDAAGARLRGAIFSDFADRYFPASAPSTRVDAATSLQHAQMLAGHWEISREIASNFLAIGNLISQVNVTAGPKGELHVPFALGLNGVERTWVEIAPFVWQDTGSHERLAAKVVDGRVVMWSIDQLSPFIVFVPTPAWRSAAWLLPMLYISLLILTITALVWPVRAVVRKRFAATLALDRQGLRAFRASRIASAAILVVLLGWAIAINAMSSNIALFTSVMDPWLWLLQIAGLFAFVGGLAAMIWNAWAAWTQPRSWQARAWSIVLIAAAATIFYVAITHGLLAMTVNY